MLGASSGLKVFACEGGKAKHGYDLVWTSLNTINAIYSRQIYKVLFQWKKEGRIRSFKRNGCPVA